MKATCLSAVAFATSTVKEENRNMFQHDLQLQWQLVTCYLVVLNVILPSSIYLFTVGVERFFIFTLSHSDSHTTVGRTPLDEGSARLRDLYLTTQTLYKTLHIHAPGGMRTHDPSKLSAADLCLRPRGHWDRLVVLNTHHNSPLFITPYFQQNIFTTFLNHYNP
jgi:hypothetical protein